MDFLILAKFLFGKHSGLGTATFGLFIAALLILRKAGRALCCDVVSAQWIGVRESIVKIKRDVFETQLPDGTSTRLTPEDPIIFRDIEESQNGHFPKAMILRTDPEFLGPYVSPAKTKIFAAISLYLLCCAIIMAVRFFDTEATVWVISAEIAIVACCIFYYRQAKHRAQAMSWEDYKVSINKREKSLDITSGPFHAEEFNTDEILKRTSQFCRPWVQGVSGSSADAVSNRLMIALGVGVALAIVLLLFFLNPLFSSAPDAWQLCVSLLMAIGVGAISWGMVVFCRDG